MVNLPARRPTPDGRGLIVAAVRQGIPILRFLCSRSRTALGFDNKSDQPEELLALFHDSYWEFLEHWTRGALDEPWSLSLATAPEKNVELSFALIAEDILVIHLHLDPPPADPPHPEEPSLTHVARGVAHDINNYLATIKATLSGLRLTTGSEWQYDDILAEALQAADDAAGLARKVLRHSRPDDGVTEWVDPVEMLKEISRIALAGSSVTMQINAENNLPGIRGESGPLRQIFSNLIINARQAMPSGGGILARIRLDGSNFPPSLVISLRDQGHGITEDVLPYIFERNFTTKTDGSGLGLDICRSIIQRHGGQIEVWSKPRIGTEFTIRFPAEWQNTGKSPPKTPIQAPIHHGTGRILIVEDQQVLRRVAATGLTRLGYQAIEAESGEAALRLFHKNHFLDNIDVAIIDLQLPGGMSGAELGRQLRLHHPHIHLIVSSGSVSPGDPVEAPFDDALPKPYGLSELSDVLLRAFTETIATQTIGSVGEEHA